MSDVKLSRALAELLGKLGNQGGIITAERVLLMLLSEENGENAERENAKKLVFDACADVKELVSGLEIDEKPTLMDDLYMKKKLREATVKAQSESMEEVTVAILIGVILNDPPKRIKHLIEVKPVSVKTTAEEQPSDRTDAESEFRRKLEEQLRKRAEEIKAGRKSRPEGEKETTEETAEPPAPAPEPEPETPEVRRGRVGELDLRIKEMARNIKSVIFGQDNAVNVFLRGYFQAEINTVTDKNRRKPKATYLFAGPPGVGKTFLAETVAGELGLPFKRFDMSEYSSQEAVTDLCGSNGVYKGAEEGQLTSFVKSNPECVLLFDEIEKAHISAIHLFLQILDAGILRDANTTKQVSFKDTIIIFTSNAGRRLYEESESDDLSLLTKKAIINALRNDVDARTGVPFFPAAICSRFATGNVVMFNRMSAHNLRSICKSEIERNARRFTDSFGVEVDIDEKVYAALLFSEGARVDARTIRARAEAFFNGEIYELTRLLGTEKAGGASVAGLERIAVSVDMDRTEASIKKLFLAGGDTKCLVFADKEKGAAMKAAVPYMNMICVDNASDAFLALKESNVDFAVIDVSCGMEITDGQALNVDDVDSDARVFFKALVARGSSVPIYMMEYGEVKITDEEKASFAAQGVRSFIRFESPEDFSRVMDEISDTVNQQNAMITLARENKIARFETAQFVSADGKRADIKIFDVDPMTVVEATDGGTMLSASAVPDITFDEVIGADGAKKEMEFFVNALKDPRQFAERGLRAPKGILMYGPPGTGKTMLAKAMAHEAGVAFIATDGNSFLSKYVGEGEEKVHKIFRTARKYAPAILFIDEIDAIGKERTGGGDGGSEARASILTALLTEMDGFVSDPRRPVFVLAATNFDVTPGTPKSLDEALLRRFDRHIYVDLPDRNARMRFLRMKTGGRAFNVTERGLMNIASRAVGMSLAKLDSVLELAMRTVMMSGGAKVTDVVLEEAFETYCSGDAKKTSPEMLERVARHEAGHAFLCWQSGETPSYLTVVSRGNHGGYMQHADKEDKFLYTRDELLANIRTALGGRAAEIVYYGADNGVSTGASGDLASATATAERLICDYGMSDEFGLAVVGDASRRYGEISAEIRGRVNAILREQMAKAIKLIDQNRDKMDRLVGALVEKNSLNAAEIDAILKGD